MTETPLADATAALERATDLEDEAAAALLAAARRDLRAARNDPTVEQDRREALETRLEQRLREVDERGRYAGDDAGAAIDPDEENAP